MKGILTVFVFAALFACFLAFGSCYAQVSVEEDAGTAAAIVATPFALPSGSMGDVGRTLIVEAHDFTFRRPLGVW